MGKYGRVMALYTFGQCQCGKFDLDKKAAVFLITLVGLLQNKKGCLNVIEHCLIGKPLTSHHCDMGSIPSIKLYDGQKVRQVGFPLCT